MVMIFLFWRAAEIPGLKTDQANSFMTQEAVAFDDKFTYHLRDESQ
jgi:hypothetical protein